MRHFTKLSQVGNLPEAERERLAQVTKQFAFRANPYYLSLIDWSDPADPIRRIIIPDQSELAEYGAMDPSAEATNYVAPGCQHKYQNTALLLVSGTCGGICRFCFRKRLFGKDGSAENTLDIADGLAYIAEHPEITNVLLTGGDPLTLSTQRLEQILAQLKAIPHVRIVRIGSKMVAFAPQRITGDPALLRLLSQESPRIYLMTHFNHPRELTADSHLALTTLRKAGVVLANQTPLLQGVNADPAVLAELMQELSVAGAAPYYVFQNRPVAGNSTFAVPLREGVRIVEEAKARLSGLAKRFKYVMSHHSGKIEILAVQDGKIYLKYHQARNPADCGRFLIYSLPEGAAWFDDLIPPGCPSPP